MSNPFTGRSTALSGPATDLAPITANDAHDIQNVAIALYVETGGALRIVTVAGETRDLNVDDYSIMPVGVRRVMATGTTASGIHAMVLV